MPCHMLRSARGTYLQLSDGDGSTLCLGDRAPDSAMWATEGGGEGDAIVLRSRVAPEVAVRGTRVDTAAAGDELEPTYRLATAEGGGADPDGGVLAAPFVLQAGPDRLPSQYLEQLHTEGLVCVPAFGPRIVEHLRAIVADELERLEASGQTEQAEFRWSPKWGYNLAHAFEADRFLCERSHHFARAQTHPVMLWLMEQYMGDGGTVPIRAAHTPVTRITLPQDGSRGPGGGWCVPDPLTFPSRLARSEAVGRGAGTRTPRTTCSTTPNGGSSTATRRSPTGAAPWACSATSASARSR